MTAPVSYSIKGAAAALGVSPRKVEALIASERLFSKWLDGKRVIPAKDLAQFVEDLPLDKPQ